MAVKKCPICKKAYEDVFKLGVHIETEHGSQIPKNWSGVKYNFYSTHGRTNGTCLVCKGRTEFDEKTGKPRRLCEKISCHKSYREQFRQNMMKKHGTDCLLNDPEVQKKMLMNRSIAKDYKWSDGTIKRCIGSYEYDALKFMDIFLNLNSGDVIVPAPQIIEYEYDGKTHFYIPDIYIDSLNLIIEIKDGGDNVNTHPKIQAVDKEKEKCKDLALETQTKYNYVKITNKQYGILMDTLIELKNRENIGGTNEKFDPVIMVRESVDMLVDNIVDNMQEEVDKLYVVFYHDKHLPIINKLGLLVGDRIYYYMEPNIMVDELDSVNIDFKYTVSIKDSAIETIVNHIGDYIYKDFEDDEEITMVNFPFVIMYMIISNYDSSEYNLSRYYCYNVYGLNDVENHQYIEANSRVDTDKIDIEDMMNESVTNTGKEDTEALDYYSINTELNKYITTYRNNLNTLSYTHKMISKLLNSPDYIFNHYVLIYYTLRETDVNLKSYLDNIIKLSKTIITNTYENFDYQKAEDFIEIIKSNDYNQYIDKLNDKEKYLLYYINLVLYDIKPIDIDFNHIMTIKHLLDKYKSSDVLNERTMDMKPSIQLSLDQDGSLLITKHEHVDFMTIFNNSHILLKEYEKVNNIEGIKYELCKLYMMKSIIDAKYIHGKSNVFTARKRDEMVKCKSFIMSDFYKYIKIVLEKDNTFNFNEYYSKTQFGIETYKIDNRLIKGLKYLTLF